MSTGFCHMQVMGGLAKGSFWWNRRDRSQIGLRSEGERRKSRQQRWRINSGTW